MRLAIVGAAVLAAAGTASAATLTVGPNGTHTTITLAAAAAADGDTILITKGRYYENVTFDDPNLKIIGKGAILDGNIAGADGICLNLTAAGITVQGLSFRNGTNQIQSSGGTLTITKCSFIDSNSTSVSVTAGDFLTIIGCKFYGAGGRAVLTTAANNVTIQKCWVRSTDSDGFDVTNANNSRFEGNTLIFIEDANAIDVNAGNNAKVLKNKILGVDDDAIQVTGNDAEVVGNTISFCNDDTGVYVSGTGALIEKNKMNVVGAGIECYGNDAEVLSNKITDCIGYTGMEVGADNVTVRGNTATLGASDAYGFYIYSNTGTGGGIIENNKCSDFIDAGYYLDSINNVVVKNCSARNCGAEDEWGIYITGSSNTMEKLSVMNQDGIGIYVSGNNNTFTACSVKNVSSDGFRVDGGDNNDFTDCTAAGCGSDGFDNRGTNSGLSGGKYRGERFDIVNDFGGGATMTLLNVDYATGGTTQANEDD